MLAGTAVAQKQFTPSSHAEGAGATTVDFFSLSNKPKEHWAELTWKASTTKAAEGYYVFRREDAPGARFESITPVPWKETKYRDTKVEPGKTYFYAVSAVQRINSKLVESERTPPVTARIPSP